MSITNSPLAEENNAVLRRLESQLAYANQTTVLWLMRVVLHKMNTKDQHRIT